MPEFWALRGDTRMKTDLLLVTLVVVAVTYTVAWFRLYRSLKSGSLSFGRSYPDHFPIETTTAAERARGDSSFVVLKERRFGITPAGFFTLVALGYVALMVGFAMAFFVISH
jgi:hypothetical protein